MLGSPPHQTWREAWLAIVSSTHKKRTRPLLSPDFEVNEMDDGNR